MSLSGIHLINGSDNEEAKRVAGILRKNRRAVHLILDSDCRDRKSFSESNLKKAGLNPENEVSFIGKKEFEDSFDEDVWLHVLNKHFPRRTGQLWTPKDLEDAHQSKKFSDYMVLTIGNCSSHISKPELGQHLARTAIKMNKIPSDIMQLMKKIRQQAEEL